MKKLILSSLFIIIAIPIYLVFRNQNIPIQESQREYMIPTEGKKEAIVSPVPTVKRNIIDVLLEPSDLDLRIGETEEVSIVLENSTSSVQEIRAAGVDLKFDSQKIIVSNPKCAESLPLSASSKIDADKGAFSLTCFQTGGSETTKIGVGEQITFGRFTISAKTKALAGETEISFNKVNIPDAKGIDDVAKEGKGLTIKIVSD